MTTAAPASAPEKLLPSNVEAETAVLGSLLIDPEAIAQVAAYLRPEDFYRDAHRTIYQAALEMYEEREPADLITLTDELARRGKLEDIGGASYVSSLATQVPTSANVEYYARIVARTATHRRLIHAAGQIAGIAYNDVDAERALEYAEALVAEARDAAGRCTSTLFPMLTDEEAENTPPARGIIGDVLYEDTIAFLYGRSGSWKSFVAVSWACSLAAHIEWLGRPTVGGEVVYICAEGARGIGKRIHAWKRRHGVNVSIPVRVIPLAVQLLDAAQVYRLTATIQANLSGAPVLVVIDTLARSMAGGNENDAADINRVVDAADRIRREFGCCVLIVHHPGKDESRGMRGSSGLFGAADTVISVTGPNKKRLEPGDVVTLTNDKPKDSEPFKDIAITTERVTFAEDSTIHPSLVVVAGEEARSAAQLTQRLTSSEQQAYDALKRLMATYPQGATHTQWKEASGLSKTGFGNARRDLLDIQYKGKGLDLVEFVTVDMQGLYRPKAASAQAGLQGQVRVNSGSLDLQASRVTRVTTSIRGDPVTQPPDPDALDAGKGA